MHYPPDSLCGGLRTLKYEHGSVAQGATVRYCMITSGLHHAMSDGVPSVNYFRTRCVFCTCFNVRKLPHRRTVMSVLGESNSNWRG